MKSEKAIPKLPKLTNKVGYQAFLIILNSQGSLFVGHTISIMMSNDAEIEIT